MSNLNVENIRMGIINKDKDYKDFLIRIRENSKDNDLVYYKGNKVFEITANNEIKIPENVYNCNVTSLCNRKDIDNYISELKNNVLNIEKYFEFSIKDIRVTIASNFDLLEFKDRLDTLNKKYPIEMIKCNRKEYSYIDLDLNELELKKKKGLTICFCNEINSFTNIIDFEKDCIINLKLDNTSDGFKPNSLINSPEFNNINQSLKNELNNGNFRKLISDLNSAIEKYEGAKEVEKKYQFEFMKNFDDNNTKRLLEKIFNENINNVDYFEQEYGIYNHSLKKISDKSYKRVKYEEKEMKKGRIDCIFTRIENDKLLDIYMIELKVNHKVILGSNGILTHLDDIKYLMSDNDQLFNLKRRIDYRYRIINNIKDKIDEDSTYLDTTETKYHFYTVIQLTDYTDSKTNISRKDMKSVVQAKLDEATKNNKKVSGADKLPNYIKNETISSLKPNKCDIKFFYDYEEDNNRIIELIEGLYE